MPRKLYLIPTPINDQAWSTLPNYFSEILKDIRIFLVEEESSARRHLKRIAPGLPIADCSFLHLNEHTSATDIKAYFNEIPDQDMGVLSEAGCPCVADPGADLVLLAHAKGIEVVPLVGPSSIILALMASGLNGQRFAFHGYLSKDKNERLKKIKSLEHTSLQENQTQIFMETPYRNQTLFEEIITTCHPETYLSAAMDLTGPEQYTKTLTVHTWRSLKPSFHKRPTLFLIQSKK